MSNLVLARIDDRLIHGQIVTSWCKSIRANIILIADENLSKDSFSQRLLRAAAPPDIKVEIMDAEGSTEYLRQNELASQKIILLTKVPQVMEELISRGVEITSINLGGMGAKTGRRQLNKNISASPEEVDCLRRLMDNGIEIYYQLVPAERSTNLRSIIKGEK